MTADDIKAAMREAMNNSATVGRDYTAGVIADGLSLIESQAAEIARLRAGGWRPIDDDARNGGPWLLRGKQRPHEMINVTGMQTFTGYWDHIDEAWCATGSTWTGPFYDVVAYAPLPTATEGV